VRALQSTALLLLAAAGGPALAQDCTPLPQRLQAMGAALDEVRLMDAADASRDAESELSCQANVVSNLGLLSLYQLSGAVQMFLGDTAQAELEFGKAIAISPTARLDASLGADAEALYDRVRGSALAVAGGVVTVEPVVQAWVDGQKVEENRPLDLAAGQHLVQVERGGELTGALFRLGPGETRSINAEGDAVLGGGSGPFTSGGPIGDGGTIAEEPRSGPRWALVASGVVGLAAGGATLFVASGAQSDFEASDDYDALSDLKIRTNALAVTGYALVGVGAGLGVVGFIDGGPGVGLTGRF